MRLNLLTLFFAYCSTPLSAQITIEPLTDCINHIIAWHRSKEESESEALEFYKEKKWYNLVPVPGVGYNFIANRPLLTFNMPDFVAYINRKKDLKYRLNKNHRSANEAISKDTVAFITAYSELTMLIQNHQAERILLTYDSVLLRIKQEENKNLQATTEDLLKVEQSVLQKKLSYQKSLEAILSKVASLETYLHRNFRISF